MSDGQEFNKTAKATYEFDGLVYWIEVNEYGAAFVKCFEGRGTKWEQRVRPGHSFVESMTFDAQIEGRWIVRIDATIKDLRGMVEDR